MVTTSTSVRSSPYHLLRERDFSLLLLGQLVSALGDKVHYIALGILVFRLTGSPLEVGKMTVAGLLPYLLFGLIAGVYVDRWNKKYTMIISDLLRAALVSLIPWAVNTNINLAYLITFGVTSLSLFFNPAKMAVIPSLFKQNIILQAAALAESTENITEVAGYALAGLITALFNLRLVFYFDAITFLFSALTILAMRVDLASTTTVPVKSQLWQELRTGLQFITGNSTLRTILGIYSVAILIFSGFSPLIFVYALQSLHTSTIGLGILESGQAIGITVGGLLLSFWGTRFAKGKLIASGYLISGLAITLIGLVPAFPIALIGFLLAGISNALFLIPVISAFQELTPDNMRGRVFSVRFTVTRFAFMLSVLYLTLLANHVGVNLVYTGIGTALTALALLAFCLKSLRTV